MRKVKEYAYLLACLAAVIVLCILSLYYGNTQNNTVPDAPPESIAASAPGAGIAEPPGSSTAEAPVCDTLLEAPASGGQKETSASNILSPGAMADSPDIAPENADGRPAVFDSYGIDVDNNEETTAVSTDSAEMLAAYSCTISENPRFTFPDPWLPRIETVTYDLYGGGLLDFNYDGINELVLIFKLAGYNWIYGCAIFTYRDGQVVEIFSKVLCDGGNWGEYSIVHKGGIGYLRVYYSQYPEGGGPHSAGGEEYHFYALENGEAVHRLGYHVNVYLTGYLYQTVVYQIWKVFRDGAESACGTTPPDEMIPEIEAIKVEAETLYGGEWTPLSTDELIEFLRAR